MSLTDPVIVADALAAGLGPRSVALQGEEESPAPLLVGLSGPRAHRAGDRPVVLIPRRGRRERLERTVRAAGVRSCGRAIRRMAHGPPADRLLRGARDEQAALVVIGGSRRPRWRGPGAPSIAAAVVRRSPRPVVVCPRDPAAAMRLREALVMARTGRRR